MTIGDDEVRRLVEALDQGRDAWIHGRLETSATDVMRQAADMTIFGPFGGDAARNGPGFEERQAAAAAAFRGGSGRCELVHAMSSGDLLVLVMIERNEVTFAGRDAAQPWVLRTTQVFRRDGERWLRLHRHADPLAARRPLDDTLAIATAAGHGAGR